MFWCVLYAIGFVVSFITLAVWEARRAKHIRGYDDAEFHTIFLYSLVWPFVWIYVLIHLIFG